MVMAWADNKKEQDKNSHKINKGRFMSLSRQDIPVSNFCIYC